MKYEKYKRYYRIIVVSIIIEVVAAFFALELFSIDSSKLMAFVIVMFIASLIESILFVILIYRNGRCPQCNSVTVGAASGFCRLCGYNFELLKNREMIQK